MKKSMLYMTALLAFILLCLSNVLQAQASNKGYIYWGEVQTGEYRPLHPYTLNWSGDVLDKGGLQLSSLELTTDSGAADFVINSYGALGARSIVKQGLGELEDRTPVSQQGAVSSITMQQGEIYLIALSSGKHAKIRIDVIEQDHVSFSYVMEAAQPAATPAATPSPSPTPVPTPMPTGSPMPATTPSQVPPSILEEGAAGQAIILTIGQADASIAGQLAQLQTAPIVNNGTTLVPLRFIAEAVGAEVDWDGDERKVTLQLNGQTIVLYIDSKTAIINGRSITLLTEPIIQNGTTLVPVRFISENFDMTVEYDPELRQITITGNRSIVAPDANQTRMEEAEYDYTKYQGSWNLWIEGGALSIYNPLTGEYVGHTFTPGASGGTLTVQSDGTYTLKTYAVTQTGTWRPADYNEVYGYEGGIILESPEGADTWAMYVTPSGKTALAYDSDGTYTDGSVIWIIQFILDK
ncbi:copper amine oxidase N-terminal domain-containing protein [Paenibacillus chungangensis]|uniref:Copper amine oxidase N-terminal domain-containing protein n=1 Tax=Paenibacillus chungangensis TaxID=696535 RepID=A0ABW3HP66_9BACL